MVAALVGCNLDTVGDVPAALKRTVHHVRGLAGADEAQAFLDRALRRGDEMSALAAALAAFDCGWTEVWRCWAAARPQRAELLVRMDGLANFMGV